MLAMVHNISWIKRDSKYYLGKTCEPFFQKFPINCTIPFVEEATDGYLNNNRPYQYTQN